jgi:maltodextrin utilization protein YvdJ
MVVPQSINVKRVLDWVNAVWAKSLAAFIMFFIGLWIGSINTESRIVSDCKFAGAFRVEIQAFNCQRRI